MSASLLAVAATLGVTRAQGAAVDTPRLRAVLDTIEHATSAQQVRDAAAHAKLTKADAQALAAELKKPRYAAAVRSLRQMAAREPRKAGASVSRPVMFSLEAAQKQMQSERAAKLARLDREAQAALVAARAEVVAPRPRIRPTRVARTEAPRPDPPESPAHIEGLSVSPVTIGREITIEGRGFGRPGEVILIVDPERRDPDGRFACTVVDWSADRIKIVVPLEVEDYHEAHTFPEGQQAALIWVTPAGDPSGDSADIRLRLDPERYGPTILTVRPSVLTPGGRFVIRGKHLTLGRTPQVVLSLHRSDAFIRYHPTLETYSDGLIAARVADDLTGVMGGTVSLYVDNGLRNESHKVEFEPVEEVRSFRSREYEAHCFSFLEEAYDMAGLCIWGEENRYPAFTEMTPQPSGEEINLRTLLHGWRFVSAAAHEAARDGHGAGCYLEHSPSAGATSLGSTDLVAWANGFCSVRCYTTLTVRGPRGVPLEPRPY